MRRRWWLAGILGLSAIGVTVGVRCARREKSPMGFIVGFSAIDADGAVIVWRGNGDGASTSWVSRIDGHGEAVWVQPLPEVAMSVGGTGPVTVVYSGDSTTAGTAPVATLDLATLTPRWKSRTQTRQREFGSGSRSHGGRTSPSTCRS